MVIPDGGEADILKKENELRKDVQARLMRSGGICQHLTVQIDY